MGTLNIRKVREKYGGSLWVVHSWIERGIIAAVHRNHNAPQVITIDEKTDRRLREWALNSAHLDRSSRRQTARGA